MTDPRRERISQDPAIVAAATVLLAAEEPAIAEVARLRARHGEHWAGHASPSLVRLVAAFQAAGKAVGL